MSLPACSYRVAVEDNKVLLYPYHECDACMSFISCQDLLGAEVCPEGWDGGAMCYPVEYYLPDGKGGWR